MAEAPYPVAILGTDAAQRDLQCGLLARLGLECELFDSAAALAQALFAGQRFSMMVLSFDGELDQARTELDHLCRASYHCAALLLLLSPYQVAMAIPLMAAARVDFLVAPYSDAQLLERMHMGAVAPGVLLAPGFEALGLMGQGHPVPGAWTLTHAADAGSGRD